MNRRKPFTSSTKLCFCHKGRPNGEIRVAVKSPRFHAATQYTNRNFSSRETNNKFCMSSLKNIRLPEFGGREATCPNIPVAEYRQRLERAGTRMQREKLDFLVVYGDREHFANLAFLTGFDPRFEEALLLLNQSGELLLLVGNECQGYLPDAAIGCRVELFQDFSLMGQPRENSRPLRNILSDFGIGPGHALGSVGWKYYDERLVANPATASDLPAYLIDLLRELVGDRQLVRNVTAWFTDPQDGFRSLNSAAQIALMEYASIHTSLAVRDSLRELRPGVRECDLPLHATASGLPYSCHTMASFGEKVRRGLSSPSQRRAELGDPFALALGIWGALTCRAGVIAESAKDLPPQLAEFFPRLAGNYFDVVVAWYEHLEVGAGAAEVYAATHAVRDPQLMDFAVNPGHLIQLDEWSHSPFQPDSRCKLRSGMAIQMDIIPVSKGPFCYANVEDGVALADESLRGELARSHPKCWDRIQARRVFMTDTIGIELDASVLPLSNMPAWLSPYALAQETAFVK
jgi:hypothetical protein